jgi:hypothetical protein
MIKYQLNHLTAVLPINPEEFYCLAQQRLCYHGPASTLGRSGSAGFFSGNRAEGAKHKLRWILDGKYIAVETKPWEEVVFERNLDECFMPAKRGNTYHICADTWLVRGDYGPKVPYGGIHIAINDPPRHELALIRRLDILNLPSAIHVAPVIGGKAMLLALSYDDTNPLVYSCMAGGAMKNIYFDEALVNIEWIRACSDSLIARDAVTGEILVIGPSGIDSCRTVASRPKFIDHYMGTLAWARDKEIYVTHGGEADANRYNFDIGPVRGIRLTEQHVWAWSQKELVVIDLD